METVDRLTAVVPQPVPPEPVLKSCKIISHRGEHDNNLVVENTLRAFQCARANGVWGIECDIRWTADQIPVICHDATGERLFGLPLRLEDLSFAELRSQMPLIPSLSELVSQFGGNTHLMLEIKAAPSPPAARQSLLLREHLAGLAPGRDYHMLALGPELLAAVDFVPRKYCYLVAELNVAALSKACLDLGCGGLAGHYLLLGNAVLARHRQAGQGIGTGFVASRYCLYRELNRGVDWIFSNDAVRLQKICNGVAN